LWIFNNNYCVGEFLCVTFFSILIKKIYNSLYKCHFFTPFSQKKWE
jgi:hypothetical protein